MKNNNNKEKSRNMKLYKLIMIFNFRKLIKMNYKEYSYKQPRTRVFSKTIKMIFITKKVIKEIINFKINLEKILLIVLRMKKLNKIFKLWKKVYKR
jgi:uncharacterized membrane protein YcgQ (UPF0703/DUF1980 family)